MKDEEDTRFAKDMVAYLHARLLAKVKAAGMFPLVIDANVEAELPGGGPALRLRGDITRLTVGSQALSAVDRRGRIVWTRRLTVSVAERQRMLPTDETLKAAMQAAVCRKLAATLLDALTAAIASDPARPER